MELTQKIRIDPIKEQEDISWILSEKCRLLYNFALGHRNKVYKETGASVTYDQQQDDLPDIKKKYPEYEWIYSKVLQMILKGLDADFKSYKMLKKNVNSGIGGDKNTQPPGYKGRDYFMTMTWNQSGFKVKDGYIILSHYYNEGKKNYVELKFEIPKDLINNTDVCLQTIYDFGKIKQITLFREESNRKKESEYYLSVVYDSPISPLPDNGLYQAIDLGINKTVTAVNMEAKFFEINNPRKDLYWNPIVDEIQSRRDHCKKAKVAEKIKYVDKKDENTIKNKNGKEKTIKVTKPSIKWISLNDVKKKCQKKAHNQIKDDQHKWSDKMIKNTKSNTIIVGELNVKEMAQSGIKIEIERKDDITKEIKKDKIRIKSKKLNRSTQNQGYISRFVGFLTYKAKKVGKRVIEISEVNTTKRCYACGKLQDMPLWKRTMRCDCGNIIDRDRNSAINIMINFLSKNALWTSYQKFVNNLKREGLLIPIWVKTLSGF